MKLENIAKKILDKNAQDVEIRYRGGEQNVINAMIEMFNLQSEKIGLMEIELNHTKTLLASCEKALNDRNQQIEKSYNESDVKKIAINFFYHWYNTPGTNTEEGFDDWFEQFKENNKI